MDRDDDGRQKQKAKRVGPTLDDIGSRTQQEPAKKPEKKFKDIMDEANAIGAALGQKLKDVTINGMDETSQLLSDQQRNAIINKKSGIILDTKRQLQATLGEAADRLAREEENFTIGWKDIMTDAVKQGFDLGYKKASEKGVAETVQVIADREIVYGKEISNLKWTARALAVGLAAAVTAIVVLVI